MQCIFGYCYKYICATYGFLAQGHLLPLEMYKQIDCSTSHINLNKNQINNKRIKSISIQ